MRCRIVISGGECMVVIDLINNLALLVALSVVSGFIGDRWRRPVVAALMQGLLFGTIAVIGILRPFHFAPGVIFDGRSVVLSLAAFFFGPVTAVVAWSMALAARILSGGRGTLTGVLVMSSAVAIGLLFHFKYPKSRGEISPFMLLLFGIVVHVIMLLLMLTLPSSTSGDVLRKVGFPILTIYPLATVLIGRILGDRIQKVHSLAGLRESEARFRSYIENSPDGIFVVNEKGSYLDVNPAAVQLTGYQSSELLGMSISALLPEESLEEAINHFEIVKREGLTRAEMRYRRKDGTLRWRSVVAVRLSPTRFLGFVQDISERRFAEDRVKSLLSEKELLLRETHHRVKNFLTMIFTLLDLQSDMQKNRGCSAILSENARRVRNMMVLYDRLYLSDYQKGIGASSFFSSLIGEIIESTAVVDVQLDLDIGDIILSPRIISPLGIIVNELINNSLKYAFEKTDERYISFSAKKTDGMVRFRYADNGAGLPDFSEKNNVQGFGLELVRMLVLQIGARLQIGEGPGAVFVIELKEE